MGGVDVCVCASLWVCVVAGSEISGPQIRIFELGNN